LEVFEEAGNACFEIVVEDKGVHLDLTVRALGKPPTTLGFSASGFERKLMRQTVSGAVPEPIADARAVIVIFSRSPCRLADDGGRGLLGVENA